MAATRAGEGRRAGRASARQRPCILSVTHHLYREPSFLTSAGRCEGRDDRDRAGGDREAELARPGAAEAGREGAPADAGKRRLPRRSPGGGRRAVPRARSRVGGGALAAAQLRAAVAGGARSGRAAGAALAPAPGGGPGLPGPARGTGLLPAAPPPEVARRPHRQRGRARARGLEGVAGELRRRPATEPSEALRRGSTGEGGQPRRGRGESGARSSTASRVPARTNEAVNARIRREAEQRVALAARHPGKIAERLRELDREWDVERVIQLGGSQPR